MGNENKGRRGEERRKKERKRREKSHGPKRRWQRKILKPFAPYAILCITSLFTSSFSWEVGLIIICILEKRKQSFEKLG